MTILHKLISATETNNLLYQIMVNDGGFDGGHNAIFTIACESPGELGLSGIETAVQALASSLSSIAAATLVSVTKVTAVETSL